MQSPLSMHFTITFAVLGACLHVAQGLPVYSEPASIDRQKIDYPKKVEHKEEARNLMARASVDKPKVWLAKLTE